ncbi:V-type ATP synthase subunit D [Lentisphaerota bacterium WC36G]|nr:V-type ATP synthase subunit D [Lentisphaerae bacterium WC36]
MAKIKLTKTELKTQRDALKQFSRFLPTLQLKKQQLQMELRLSKKLLQENEAADQALRDGLASWIVLFGDKANIEDKVANYLTIEKIDCDKTNIAGVTVPVFNEVLFSVTEYDLYSEEPYLDDVIQAVKDVISIREAHKVLEEQFRLLENELRLTTQRVNLFEKVKIPECKENIRRIQIYLGDMDTAAVARSKIAKGKGVAA